MSPDIQHPYDRLTPDRVLDAVESRGYVSDMRILALNSYENRVYQVGIEDSDPLIAKFYRPERWSKEQILEEHQFSIELQQMELPIVAPLADKQGETLHEFEGFMFALFPRQGGYAPELDNLDNLDNLLIMGRTLGRMHKLGASKPFEHRPEISLQRYGIDSVEYLIANNFIPSSLKEAYETLTRDILHRLVTINSREPEIPFIPEYDNENKNESGSGIFTAKDAMKKQHAFNLIRVHGDCHIGNILWRNNAPHFVDFDDTAMAPAIQDLWMLLSGDRQNQTLQMAEILEGYTEFMDFSPAELNLVEYYRTLRLLNYSGWLARRWDDPAFPMAFTWFNTERYWAEHILELREQLAALDEPPLAVFGQF